MSALGVVGTSRLLRRHALTAVRSRCSSCAAEHVANLVANSSRPLPGPGSLFSRRFASKSGKRPRFSQRLGEALRNSKITWYHIPVGVGIGFLGLVQFYKVTAREERRRREEADGVAERPSKRRPKVRPEGPCLDEVAEPDLRTYPNLAAFFYRRLKPGARPLEPDSHALLCPSDGKVLQYGKIAGGDIEQVKGMTYSVDALLGKSPSGGGLSTGRRAAASGQPGVAEVHGDEAIVKQEEEFAKMNGISYTLPDLLLGRPDGQQPHVVPDASVPEVSQGAISEVRADLALGEKPWYDARPSGDALSLYYAVIYLAPGDYHRFHSPTNWVVERRRHFAGELYSVSPYLQRTLPGLFTLNERVVLLGRWRYGFFSYVPVGATNVGSIKVSFDRELRTNSLLTDTAADRAAEEAARRGEPYLGFAEASYEGASSLLRGHALRRGEEMGGFQLGSTIVLVFEAPCDKHEPGKPSTGWQWAVEKGQKVKMGQALGRVVEAET
ncbi:hypothetical protein UVI_02006220 [Ustilaginoidea virens]|uniref:Phosphatidylserine decarboxylase proenzyme 1, mitochondrial n=1 Tax=Ustilaginoidea virens TaxID=1159556 RepID=A0A1B5L3U6_USTVR|nr:hypothetical protein UVI_02006220 [Ustilaginoidea virens]